MPTASLAAERTRARAAATPRESREKATSSYSGSAEFTPLDGSDPPTGGGDGYRMANGLFWPIPITLSAGKTVADGIKTGAEVALVDPDDGSVLATLRVTEKYAIDKAHECMSVFRTTDAEHPGVKMVMEQGEVNLAGPVKVLSDGGFSAHYGDLFMTPAQTRAAFEKLGWSKVAAFQTRNPMHRSHEYLAKVAIETCDGVLIHSLLGNLKPGESGGGRQGDRRRSTATSARHGDPRRHRLTCYAAAGGAAARALPPELRLFAPNRRP
jgi:sulfate adenylyltransferase